MASEPSSESELYPPTDLPKSRAAQLQTWVKAAESAHVGIETLKAGLPSPDAAIKLNHLFVLLADTLTGQFGQVDASGKKAGPVTIDVDTIAVIAWITDALMDYVHSNIGTTQSLLGYLSEWPVIASIEPSRDSRRVVKDPDGAAAKRCKPLADHLGKMKFFPGKLPSDGSIFRQIAGDAAQCAYVMNLNDWAWRKIDLPGVRIRGCEFQVAETAH